MQLAWPFLRHVIHVDPVLLAATDKVARAIWNAMMGETTGKIIELPRRKRG